ncbi:MAG TPA: type I restriction enzyme HsdR N-terminal domain-containing protein [Cyclobacteriaceae bacterium]|nr:type I restriction enzyme HsdR N-terminal domain-containing protein [Cyclobacteriaceae bacterium]
MIKLNLPSYEYKLKKTEGKIFVFDIIRRKYVLLTPEEWVRQHFIHFLINQLNYPRVLIKVESGLSFNHLKKRSDIVIYDRSGDPWMVIECKSPDQKINQRTVQQVSVYNRTIKAKYVGLTNGLTHICCVVNHEERTTDLLDQFPQFNGIGS